jgi:hypothetical protein
MSEVLCNVRRSVAGIRVRDNLCVALLLEQRFRRRRDVSLCEECENRRVAYSPLSELHR